MKDIIAGRVLYTLCLLAFSLFIYAEIKESDSDLDDDELIEETSEMYNHFEVKRVSYYSTSSFSNVPLNNDTSDSSSTFIEEGSQSQQVQVSESLNQTSESENLNQPAETRSTSLEDSRVELDAIQKVIIDDTDKDYNTDTVLMELDAGWNLLSIPFTDCNHEDLLIHSMGPVWSWDSINGEYIVIDIPESQQGFWLYLEEPKIVALTGTISEETLPLLPGWNLVGPCFEQPLPENCDVFTWDEYYQSISSTSNLERAKGYWIYQK